MKIFMSKSSYGAEWYDYEGCRLKIKPYPMGRVDFANKDGATIFSSEERFKMFDYSLVAWEGVVDEDGAALLLTKQVKKQVFEYRLGGISDFVLETSTQVRTKIEEQEKNLPSG